MLSIIGSSGSAVHQPAHEIPLCLPKISRSDFDVHQASMGEDTKKEVAKVKEYEAQQLGHESTTHRNC